MVPAFVSRLRQSRFAREASLVVGLASLAVSNPRMALAASSSGGGGLPWETPLQTVQQSITGPVAYGISLIAIVAAGATLVWGGEISEFTRRIIFVVLVIALIALAAQLYSTLFSSGAVIG